MGNTDLKKVEKVEQKELTQIDRFKWQLTLQYMKQIKNSIWEKECLKFMWTCVHLVKTVPRLLDVERSSLFNAIMQWFELWLSIWPLWEFYILPYWNKAQGQIGYKWIVKLLYWAWVQSIRSEIVYKNDNFKNINWIINHEIDIFKSSKDRWEPIGAYVIAKVNWEEISKAMNIEDIFKFREFSKSKNYDSSPWKNSNDPELNMWKKTVLKQLAKMLPQNDTLAKAIEIDNRDSTISDKKINEMSSDEVISKTLENFWEWEEWLEKEITKV